eukprot:675167-Pyramimonas_sp.AAC.1
MQTDITTREAANAAHVSDIQIQIYLTILHSYKVTDVDDTMHDFERVAPVRMRDDGLHRLIVDQGDLYLECREPPDANIFESLFRTQ